MERKQFDLGNTVKLKKKHPCGSWEWVITRMGADIKIKCLGCGHQVMLPRSQFEKSLVCVVKKEEC
ncbi:MAG: DUF951 domain-containing protein [Chitinophagales bacterium]